MPSRFQNLAPHTEQPSRYPEWDAYDNCPLDPAYVAPVSLASCTRKPSA